MNCAFIGRFYIGRHVTEVKLHALFSDASPFLARPDIDVVLNRRWKLEDLVPGLKRFARSVVWKTFNKNLHVKDALSCLAPRGFDAMPNPRWG